MQPLSFLHKMSISIVGPELKMCPIQTAGTFKRGNRVPALLTLKTRVGLRECDHQRSPTVRTHTPPRCRTGSESGSRKRGQQREGRKSQELSPRARGHCVVCMQPQTQERRPGIVLESEPSPEWPECLEAPAVAASARAEGRRAREPRHFRKGDLTTWDLQWKDRAGRGEMGSTPDQNQPEAWESQREAGPASSTG